MFIEVLTPQHNVLSLVEKQSMSILFCFVITLPFKLQ